MISPMHSPLPTFPPLQVLVLYLIGSDLARQVDWSVNCGSRQVTGHTDGADHSDQYGHGERCGHFFVSKSDPMHFVSSILISEDVEFSRLQPQNRVLDAI